MKLRQSISRELGHSFFIWINADYTIDAHQLYVSDIVWECVIACVSHTLLHSRPISPTLALRLMQMQTPTLALAYRQPLYYTLYTNSRSHTRTLAPTLSHTLAHFRSLSRTLTICLYNNEMQYRSNYTAYFNINLRFYTDMYLYNVRKRIIGHAYIVQYI